MRPGPFGQTQIRKTQATLATHHRSTCTTPEPLHCAPATLPGTRESARYRLLHSAGTQRVDPGVVMRRHRLLVVDSHDGFWEGAALKLRVEAGIHVVIHGPLSAGLLARIDEIDPHAVGVDIGFPAPAAVEMLGQLAWRSPAVPVIAICDSVDDARLGLALAAGARALIGRNTRLPELARIVHEVAIGGFPLQDDLARRPSLLGEFVIEMQRRMRPAALQEQAGRSSSRCPLTEREVAILEMVAGGRANKEIAELLEIAERTVKNHVANILDKLAARGRAHAVALALENHWIGRRENGRQAVAEGVA